jgi:hypothetical protein
MPEQEDYIVEASKSKNGDGVVLEKKHYKRTLVYIVLVFILLINFAVLWCVRQRMKREVS